MAYRSRPLASASARPTTAARSGPSLPAMTSITHLALRHRRLVALAWIALTVVGVLTVSSATGGLSHNFNTPGTAGYDANAHIIKSLGIDGNEQPTIAVLHLPVGRGHGYRRRPGRCRAHVRRGQQGGPRRGRGLRQHAQPEADLTRRSDHVGADRRAQPRCRRGAGRGGPDPTRAARRGTRRRVRLDDRVRADPIEWWRWRRWAERARHHGDRRARRARRAPVRVRLGDRDRAAADRDPVDPHHLPARPRAGAGDQRQLPGRVPGRRDGARGRCRLLAAADHPLARGTRRRTLERGGDPRRRPHGRPRGRPERSDRRRRPALARGAAGAVPAQHRARLAC